MYGVVSLLGCRTMHQSALHEDLNFRDCTIMQAIYLASYRGSLGSSERLGMEGCVCVRQHATPLQGALFRSHESVVIEFVYLG